MLTEGEYTISAVPPQFIPQSAVTRATRIRLLLFRRTSSGMYSSRRGCPFSPAKGSLKRCCGSTSFRHSILQYSSIHFCICQAFYCAKTRYYNEHFIFIPNAVTNSIKNRDGRPAPYGKYGYYQHFQKSTLVNALIEIPCPHKDDPAIFPAFSRQCPLC